LPKQDERLMKTLTVEKWYVLAQQSAEPSQRNRATLSIIKSKNRIWRYF